MWQSTPPPQQPRPSRSRRPGPRMAPKEKLPTKQKQLNKYTWFWSFPNDKNVEYICSAIVTNSQHVQVPIPTPKKNEVLLKLEAASLNPGDCKIQKGQARPIFPRKLPHIPVTDVAGEVVELGEDVKNFKVGDKVVAMLSYGYGGGLGEFAAANAEMVVARPSEVSAADGAGLPVAALSAHWALTKDAEIKLDGTDEPKNILITGASGNVGLYAVQLAKLGNAHVTATCGARRKGFLVPPQMRNLREQGGRYSRRREQSNYREDLEESG
ncbi:hypothetical protein ACLB2K_039049 [Fragaria x ananassa]